MAPEVAKPATKVDAPAPEPELQTTNEAPEQEVAAAPRMRAKFVVSEITQTARGVSVVKLDAAHDAGRAHTGGIGARPQAATPVVPDPQGSISLEVDPSYAAGLVLGAAFYLVSA